MTRMQVLQMAVQVLQLVVTAMVLTLELRRLGGKSTQGRDPDGAGAEPRTVNGHHMLIPLFLTPAAVIAARGALSPWTVHSPTSSPLIALAPSR